MTSSPVFVALLVLGTQALAAQRPAQARALGQGATEFPEPFTAVTAVRELSDGRVLVIDAREVAATIVDWRAGTSTPVGRRGSGPGEYQSTRQLLALGGDTTLLVDAGQRRLVAFSGAGTVVPMAGLRWPIDAAIAAGPPSAVDGRERAYYTSRAFSMSGERPVPLDSAFVVRVARGGGRVDTMARVALVKTRIDARGDGKGNLATVDIVRPPINVHDDWVVFPDGAVAVIRVDPYRVDWILDGGTMRVGAPLPFVKRALGTQDKQMAFAASRGPSANRSTIGGPNAASAIPPGEWPAFVPPFAGPSALAAPDGRVWIRRLRLAADNATTLDVVGRDGRRIEQVTIAGRGQVVGFGRGVAYITRVVDDDLQYLQRVAMPGRD